MRSGKFYINWGNSDCRLDVKDVTQVFQIMRFVPTRVQYLFECNKFEYVGYSPLFEEISDAIYPPDYDLNIESNSDGDVINVIATKVDKQ